MFLFFLGLSTYGVIAIRANSDIPMNQNEPSDVFRSRYYLSRESSMGAHHLFMGRLTLPSPSTMSVGRL